MPRSACLPGVITAVTYLAAAALTVAFLVACYHLGGNAEPTPEPVHLDYIQSRI